MRPRVKKVLKWFGLTLVFLMIFAVILRLVIFDLVNVAGDEMWPGVGKDAWLLVNRRASPQRGDLVVVKTKDGYVARRVVALPGEKLALPDGRPVVPGHEAKYLQVREVTLGGQQYLIWRETIDGRSWEILDDKRRRMVDVAEKDVGDGYFVMADNREHASDSRHFGVVKRADVRGVVSWQVTEGERP
jgi:signal peptidase I